MKFLSHFFTTVNQSLILSVLLLSIASFFLRISQTDILDLPYIVQICGVFFTYLPVIFAISISLSLTKNQSGAALTALIGYFVFTKGLTVLSADAHMGIFAGLVIGCVSGYIHNRYISISLPKNLKFIGHEGVVLIVMTVVSMFLSIFFSIFWSGLESSIEKFAIWLTGMDNLGLFGFEFFNKLLMPFGLSQPISPMILPNSADFASAFGTIIQNDSLNYFTRTQGSGIFMSGGFPTATFGAAGCALAIIWTAKDKNKKIVRSIMGLTAAVSFLTGISAPLEFTFMFFSFPLYIVYAFLSALAGPIMRFFDVILGYAYAPGLLDYIEGIRLSSHPLRFFPVGVLFFFLYFFIFSFCINVLKLKTIGTIGADEGLEVKTNDKIEVPVEVEPIPAQEKVPEEPQQAQPQLFPIPDDVPKEFETAAKYVDFLGGTENIRSMKMETTTINFEVSDSKPIDEIAIRKLGAKGVLINEAGIVQVIVGSEVRIVGDKIRKFLDAKNLQKEKV